MDIQHSQKSKDRWCKGYPSKHAKKMLKLIAKDYLLNIEI